MKLLNILNFLKQKGSAGANLSEFVSEFGDDNVEDIKRLLESGILLKEIKKEGKARGIRYYLFDTEIVRITTENIKQNSTVNSFVEKIDVSDCKTTKSKIERIIKSDHKLEKLHNFYYRESIEDRLLNRELYDFMHHGTIDFDVSVHFNNDKKRNEIYSKREKVLNNKITLSRSRINTWELTKHHYECPDRPETQTFESWAELEKCLKTLFTK